jgi:diaminopimelate decarboxylase
MDAALAFVSMRAESTSQTAPWWERPGLEVRNGRLHVAGRDAVKLARIRGTPLFVYDLERMREQVRALQSAFASGGLRARVRLALKAQREPEALAFLRDLGAPGTPESIGMDVCSPGELLLALEHGWNAEEISYTGTNVSDRDLDVILAHDVHLNVDLLTQIDRVGRRAPHRVIGLRVNPRAGAGYRTAETVYSGSRPSKFGIFPEGLDDAVARASAHGLVIDTVHTHVGRAFLTPDVPRFEMAVERVAAMAARLREAGCPIAEVNIGGGLGVPLRPEDAALDLHALVAALKRHLGPLDVVVGVEPGDFIAKESAVLLAEVVSVEDRDGIRFVGLDAGWNLVNDGFIYAGPQQVVACARADAAAAGRATIAGHINEGDDLFAEDHPLPAVEEGDVVALLSCGSYAQSMTIVHCLRPPAPAVFFPDRIRPKAH